MSVFVAATAAAACGKGSVGALRTARTASTWTLTGREFSYAGLRRQSAQAGESELGHGGLLVAAEHDKRVCGA